VESAIVGIESIRYCESFYEIEVDISDYRDKQAGFTMDVRFKRREPDDE